MTGTSWPRYFLDHQMYYNTLHPIKAFHANYLPPEPTTFSQAFKISEWRGAMDTEFGALIANGSWTLSPGPPKKKNHTEQMCVSA